MKLLHFVEIENFKRYGSRQRISLEHPSVLIGPNNCGKTSILQAVALWSVGLKTWRSEAENSKAEEKTGKALNRLNILSVPVPKTRHFWNNLRVSKRNITITVGVDIGGKPHPVTMVFNHHASDELVYCKPAPESLTDEAAFAAAGKLDVALLYPMSGISADEEVILPQRIEFYLGRGSTAGVLRNICLLVFQKAPEDWKEIAGLMLRLFPVHLSDPLVNKNGAVDLAYRQEETTGEMDLALSGRGFQQMLLIFAYLYLHKGSVLLIDEPDAHLEILRQQQVYVLLRDIARKNGCQVALVTHSEVLLREALDSNLSLILHGQVENLAAKEDIKNSLKHFGAEHYVRAKETGHVLYVEGSTDVDMLKAFARKLKHPVAAFLDDGSKLNTYYLQDNFPDAVRQTEVELERVEGGYGLSAEKHFNALKRMLPELRGLAIHDDDGRGRGDQIMGDLRDLVWRRYEAENYFITPELLLASARHPLGVGDLFQNEVEVILQALMLERIFDGSVGDLENYQRADASTRKTLWRAQTQRRKLSDFAEEYFRRVAVATGTPMMQRKGSFHELISVCDPAELNGDVKEKLDALQALISRSG
jgi:ABC-type branched-subunit amino acid transport system ATPase component